MTVAVITGSGGLIGSEAARAFSGSFDRIVGLDNDLRATFFGPEASTAATAEALARALGNYRHEAVDIRDVAALERIFGYYGGEIGLVVHTAAQPSHDWAARDPLTDFTVNANGTLALLEATRRHCPEAVFIHTSTNKVYGDRPNALPLEELDTRWELAADHAFFAEGIDESMSIDETTHSLFGVSKLAADQLVQEYGRNFGLKSAVFRAGCLTGPDHAGAQLHGFLAYLLKCVATGAPYTVFGYKGKQVRDNLHCADLVAAFAAFHRSPRLGAVYNVGGGRASNCSMLEAISLCEELAGRPLDCSYSETNRIGDHIWWISDCRRFKTDYPDWQPRYDVAGILTDILEHNRDRWQALV